MACIQTQLLAIGKKRPRVITPVNGPPTTPKMLIATWMTSLPKMSERKAKAIDMRPKTTTVRTKKTIQFTSKDKMCGMVWYGMESAAL